MRRVLVLFVVAAAMAGGGPQAQAEGLQIKPGLWQTTMTNPMTGPRTVEECVRETAFDPMSLLNGQDGCQVTEQTVDSNTLSYRIACGADGAGEGWMASDGDTGEGEMTMSFNLDGQPMQMTISWDARRLGDC